MWRLAETGVSLTSVHRIVRANLHLFPYRIQKQTQLTNDQRQRRVAFAEWLSQKVEEDEDFMKHIHFSDECHVQLGEINRQNVRIWGSENPHEC